MEDILALLGDSARSLRGNAEPPKSRARITARLSSFSEFILGQKLTLQTPNLTRNSLDHKTANIAFLDDHKHINLVCLYPLLWSRQMLWSCTNWHHGLVCGLPMCYLELCFSTVCWDPELGWPDVLILLELSLETFCTVHSKQLTKWNNAKCGTKAWATEPAIYWGSFSLQQLQVFSCTSFAIEN